MTFYRLDDVPVGQDDQVFRVSPVGKAIAMVLMFGLAITSLVLGLRGWTTKGMSPGAPWFFAVVFGLFGLIPLSLFRASLRPSAWLARCSLTGIILKYRGYENWRLPTDAPQAVGFDYGEIASVKLVKEQRTSPNGGVKGGTTISSFTYLEFALARPDTTELETRLQAERAFQPEGKIVADDYPVQVMPGGIVQVRWTGIHPAAAKAVEIMGRHLQVLSTENARLT